MTAFRSRIRTCIYVLIPLLALAFTGTAAADHSVAGHVVDSTGGALPGAVVEIEAGGSAREVFADERGSFRFAGVPAGRATLVARLDGFAARRVEFVIGPDTGALRLVLEPAGFRQEVTVTATRVETPVTALANTVTLVEAETIQARTALSDDLPSLLESAVPGFGPSLKKLTGRAETLRGRNPLYTINGVPQHTPLRDGERDGHTIDLDFVERVEVIHGSNAIQGIGATGGVVNMVTKAPHADGSWTHDVRLSVGNGDGFEDDGWSTKASYLVGRRVGSFDFVAGASAHLRGLFYDAEGNPVGLYPTQGDIMDSRARNLYFKGGVALDAQRRLELTFNDFRLARDGDFVVRNGNRARGLLTGTVEGDPRPTTGDPAENDVTTASLEYRDRDLASGEFVAQAYLYDYWALFEGGAFGTFALTTGGPAFLDQSAIRSDKLGLKLTYQLPHGRLAGFTPTFGLDLSQDESAQVLARTDRVWVPDTRLRAAAPFAQVQRVFGDRLIVSGGLRVELARLQVDDYTTLPSSRSTFVAGGSPSFSRALPNAGVVFHATDRLSTYASWSQGFTMPDVGRVLRAVSTPGLSVERLVDVEPIVTGNAEFGVDWRSRRVRAHAAWYRSGSDRGSILDPTPEGIFNVRREPTRIEGLDATLELAPGEAWRLGGSFAWLRGRYDTNGDGDPDTDLDGANLGPNRLNLFASATLPAGLSARLQVSRLLDRAFRGPAAQAGRDFEGYTTADLSVAAETGLGRFRLGVENLFDRQYVTYFSQTEAFLRNDTYFAGQGRTLSLVFERRF